MTSKSQTYNEFGFGFDKSTRIQTMLPQQECVFKSAASPLAGLKFPLALWDLILDPGRAVTSIRRAVFGSARSELISACQYIRPHLLLFDSCSVVSVEALSNGADVRLSIHPDLSENPLTLFKPLGPVQVWSRTQK